jgi:ADP-heptose:LPS heptosyltransferase
VSTQKKRILVIRLGALGDLVFCFQSFAEIRAAHPDAEIALLTRAPFAAFARSLPWFDRIIIDSHPTLTQLGGWSALLHDIRAFAPECVYDLQGKTRQTILYMLLGATFGPAWSGAAPFCKFPRVWPPTAGMHFTDFLAAQLRAAGVPAASPINLDWFDAPVAKFALPAKYAALIPGCSPDALHKRWSARSYAALARALHARGLVCIVVGTLADAEAIAAITDYEPGVINLCGKTSLFELAGLLRRATLVIGNDTGPVHMAATIGAPTLALFSGRSNPTWSKPPGPHVASLQRADLAALDVGDVLAALDALIMDTRV